MCCWPHADPPRGALRRGFSTLIAGLCGVVLSWGSLVFGAVLFCHFPPCGCFCCWSCWGIWSFALHSRFSTLLAGLFVVGLVLHGGQVKPERHVSVPSSRVYVLLAGAS